MCKKTKYNVLKDKRQVDTSFMAKKNRQLEVKRSVIF